MYRQVVGVLCCTVLSVGMTGCYQSHLRDADGGPRDDARTPGEPEDARVSRDLSADLPGVLSHPDGGLPVDITYFKPSNTGAGDGFGWALAQSNSWNGFLLVGAPFEDSHGTGLGGGDPSDNSVSDSGAVYAFYYSSASASQSFIAKASNTGAGDHFGWAVSAADYGASFAVGAPGEASTARGVDGDQSSDGAPGSGAVYVFMMDPDTGLAPVVYLKASNSSGTIGGMFGDEFGCSVSMSADGQRVAVGARYESSRATGVGGDQSNDAAPRSGAVYVFARSGMRWTQEAYIKPSNTAPGQLFGSALALSADGTRLLVGAPGEDSIATGVGGDARAHGAPESGAAYVFARSGSSWTQDVYIKASNTGAGDRFGTAVSMAAAGDWLVVGAPGEDSDAIGAGGDQASDRASDSGAVYVFARASVWAQVAYLKASNTGAGDNFGATLSFAEALESRVLAVGAPGESSIAVGIDGDERDDTSPHAGAAYVFALGGAEWVEQSYFKTLSNSPGDQFGASISLAGDPVNSNLVVGVPFEDSATFYIDGLLGGETAPDSGAVFGYRTERPGR